MKLKKIYAFEKKYCKIASAGDYQKRLLDLISDLTKSGRSPFFTKLADLYHMNFGLIKSIVKNINSAQEKLRTGDNVGALSDVQRAIKKIENDWANGWKLLDIFLSSFNMKSNYRLNTQKELADDDVKNSITRAFGNLHGQLSALAEDMASEFTPDKKVEFERLPKEVSAPKPSEINSFLDVFGTLYGLMDGADTSENPTRFNRILRLALNLDKKSLIHKIYETIRSYSRTKPELKEKFPQLNKDGLFAIQKGIKELEQSEKETNKEDLLNFETPTKSFLSSYDLEDEELVNIRQYIKDLEEKNIKNKELIEKLKKMVIANPAMKSQLELKEKEIKNIDKEIDILYNSIDEQRVL